jgi:hypothetical protein
MKKQILNEEFRRMQKLAGLITETLKKGDTVKIKNPDVNLGDEGKIIKVYADYDSIPKGDIGYYELDIDVYEEEDLNKPWYKIKQGDVDQIYSASDLNEGYGITTENVSGNVEMDGETYKKINNLINSDNELSANLDNFIDSADKIMETVYNDGENGFEVKEVYNYLFTILENEL